VDKLGIRTQLPTTVQIEDQQPLKKVIQVGRKGRIRVTTSNPDPVILPKRLGRHTGLRAWLANLELTYIVWKLDSLCGRINDFSDPYQSSNLSEDLAHDLDAISVEAYLKQHTCFKV
jgi:hypothetical protein